MDEQAYLRGRIRRRLDELGRGPIAAATKVGLERSYISDFLKEKKQSIKATELSKVASALDWSVEDLLGKKVAKRGKAAKTTGIEPSVNVQIVPEIDVRAGASYAGGTPESDIFIEESGAPLNSDAIRATWGVPVPFLRDELGVKPSRVHILPVRGDSMAGTLYDGDRAIIDLDDIDVSQGGIFAVLDDYGSVIVKQVELVRGTESPTIRCKSRNPAYEPFDLVLADPVKVIGRVACKITRL